MDVSDRGDPPRAGFLTHHPTRLGMLQGTALLAALWTAWEGYSWLTNAVPAEEAIPARLLIFCAMAAMFYFASELLDYGRRDIGRQKVLLAGALVSGGLVCATHRRDAALRCWHLTVGGDFYLAFLVAAVFAVV